MKWQKDFSKIFKGMSGNEKHLRVKKNICPVPLLLRETEKYCKLETRTFECFLMETMTQTNYLKGDGLHGPWTFATLGKREHTLML